MTIRKSNFDSGTMRNARDFGMERKLSENFLFEDDRIPVDVEDTDSEGGEYDLEKARRDVRNRNSLTSWMRIDSTSLNVSSYSSQMSFTFLSANGKTTTDIGTGLGSRDINGSVTSWPAPIGGSRAVTAESAGADSPPLIQLAASRWPTSRLSTFGAFTRRRDSRPAD